MKIILIFLIIISLGVFLAPSMETTPTTIPILLAEGLAALLAWEFGKMAFGLLAGAMVIYVLTKVQATKWLFMTLIAGSLWIATVMGGGRLPIVAIVVIVATLGVFGFFFSRSWEKTSSYDDKDRPVTVEKGKTDMGFRGDTGEQK